MHLVGLGHQVVQAGGAVRPGGLLVLELQADRTQAAHVGSHKDHIQKGEVTHTSHADPMCKSTYKDHRRRDNTDDAVMRVSGGYTFLIKM